MSSFTATAGFSSERIAGNRKQLAAIRAHARRLFDHGATGIQVAAALSEQTDRLLLSLLTGTMSEWTPAQRAAVENGAAVIAVGGSGRGELAPCSDTDLLFLYTGKAAGPFAECTARMVRDCWDAGLSLGHAVRTIGETITLARQDPEIATSVAEARLLWGSRTLFEAFVRRFRRGVFSRAGSFLEACIAAREQERYQFGYAVSQLEPDLKRSLGGLRDVHLIRWIGAAVYGGREIESLRLAGALTREDARGLLEAQDFLMRVRHDLHFVAGRVQDVLTREEQLRMTEERGIEGTEGQRPVERFMQQYFRHSSAIAEIAQRFVDLHRRKPVRARVAEFMTTRRINRIFKIGEEELDVIPRHRRAVCGNLDQILRMYTTAVQYQVRPSAHLTQLIRESVAEFPESNSDASGGLFLNLLRVISPVGPTLRSMYYTGTLELLLPEMTHARCLLQFNQYHSYTVDEHTLRAVEAAEDFGTEKSPLGTAYRAIHHKETLRLAILLHDLGKGFKEDHSDVGRKLAEDVATRFDLPGHQRETLLFLVHKHLRMAHLAFRRDISDPQVLVEFAQEVGSPETLRMLFVLTAADLRAVGPGVWTDWKAELLGDLYDRAMLVLSGKHHRFQEEERLRRVKEHVRSVMLPAGPSAEADELKKWIDKQLQALPVHYLTGNSPAEIASDLKLLWQLQPETLSVRGEYDPETGTVEYRILASPELAEGCFHKTAGILAARRLQILSAQISTCYDGTVIDSYKVIDDDYRDRVPPERIEEVSRALETAMMRKTSVPQMFQRYMRFHGDAEKRPVARMPIRVAIDNDSSDYCTVIDIFAHDRPGLLYTITRALYQMGLSVLLAKISTHLDQVVDVFYVTDSENRKIRDGDRLNAIQEDLLATIEEFEREEYRQFIS